MDLTIVIPNYETRALLDGCLALVAKASAELPGMEIETIVVDNGSLDGSVATARTSSCAPRVVALVRNRGFAAAVNRGLRLRKGRHVLLLNTDAEIDAAVLSGGVAILDRHPDVGALGVALRHPDGRAQRSEHLLPGLATELLPDPFVRTLRRRARVRSGGRDVEAVRGAVFFMNGDALKEMRALDEGYFFFLEETDYCARLAAAGYRVQIIDGVHATHRLGASSKSRAPLATRIEYHRSLYRYLEEHHGRAVAGLARGVRLLRNAIGCVASIPFFVTSRYRSRLAQRWGLVLWHLRGCPTEPGLATELRRAARRE